MTSVLDSRKRKFGGSVAAFQHQEQLRKVLKIVSVEKDMRAAVPADLHPHEYLAKKLSEKGIKIKVAGFEELDDFFSKPTEEEIDNYKFDIIDAVRNSDISTLRKFMQEGRPMKCSNRFGESLLHLACRKQRINVVDFLLNEASVSAAVCDDFGRNPLHDACWTPSPNFTLVDTILKKCPDLLFIKDKRGHTPLFYARQNHWEQWIRHLESKMESIVPSEQFIMKDETSAAEADLKVGLEL